MSIRPVNNNESDIVILGLGNTLLMDEGVGVFVANKLKDTYNFNPQIEIIDGGTFGLDLLPYIENKEKVLIIDAVNFGRQSGYIGVLKNDEIVVQINTKMSVHHIGLSDIISATKLRDTEPNEMVMVGIQPKSLDTGMELTTEIRNKIDDIIKIILTQLDKWNIEHTHK
ncbi:MAG: HyaD/HybD family hydrogenase maturation endopeptidase [Candidatus Marinimicrobia bacterium]|nr:HyaD/HybD family hydrogenase maturation endopeptidase [Candidatus Neomarinimicrobiota bacterium]MBL7022504.1 HyaD/HybD family hydrogenase maturation endopeptidase [Candidatus Neomarinimicrobiota bacterium]MBL7108641.1 HyaD/HybD family hydrogenase maturation endopeptidase [Candidatus Neomarinimicrobiota bacterium]